MNAPICLIVNPSAGGGRGGRLAPNVERELRVLGLVVRREDTRDLDHARQLAAAAAAAGETVVALSGDGLIRVIADVLREIPGALLGVLPGGRGNDLARVLGIPRDPIAACATIADGIARPLDLGLVREVRPDARAQAFVGIASVGFDSEANRIANHAPSWLGPLVYAYGALRALIAWRSASFQLLLTETAQDDPASFGERLVASLSYRAYTVGAANSRAYGGGMYAAPDALLDDGLLDVMVLRDVSRLTFVTRILPKVFGGTHVNEPCVEVHRSREVTIDADRPFTMYADGDPIGVLPVQVRALPGAVRVLVPRAQPARDSAFLHDLPDDERAARAGR